MSVRSLVTSHSVRRSHGAQRRVLPSLCHVPKIWTHQCIADMHEERNLIQAFTARSIRQYATSNISDYFGTCLSRSSSNVPYPVSLWSKTLIDRPVCAVSLTQCRFNACKKWLHPQRRVRNVVQVIFFVSVDMQTSSPTCTAVQLRSATRKMLLK
jgi:hypothetical protein